MTIELLDLPTIETLGDPGESPCTDTLPQLTDKIDNIWNIKEGRGRVRGLLEALYEKKSSYELIVQVNRDIEELNVLIMAYNTAGSIEEKKSQWNLINQKINQIDAKYPDAVVIKNSTYQEIFYSRLFHAMQTQKKLLQSVEKETLTFSSFIDNLPPEKLSQIAATLFNCDKDSQFKSIEQLRGIFLDDLEKDFLDLHTISFIGGSNSKNFKITHTLTGNTCVLKIENRMDAGPRDIDDRLSSISVSNHLTSTQACRRSVFLDPMAVNFDKPSQKTCLKARNVIVTEFCEGGDLSSRKTQPQDSSDRLRQAVDYYQQMAEILLELEKNNIAFPDMKNDNWLLHHGKLKIADTKTFLNSEPGNGVLERYSPLNEWHGPILASSYIEAPEISEGDASIVLDKMHSFSWGKCLYQFLTGVDSADPSFSRLSDANTANFDYPIFQTPQGQALKELIIQTVVTDPDARLPLADALTAIKRIQATVPLEKGSQSTAIDVYKIELQKIRSQHEDIENQPPQNFDLH